MLQRNDDHEGQSGCNKTHRSSYYPGGVPAATITTRVYVLPFLLLPSLSSRARPGSHPFPRRRALLLGSGRPWCVCSPGSPVCYLHGGDVKPRPGFSGRKDHPAPSRFPVGIQPPRGGCGGHGMAECHHAVFLDGKCRRVARKRQSHSTATAEGRAWPGQDDILGPLSGTRSVRTAEQSRAAVASRGRLIQLRGPASGDQRRAFVLVSR